MTTIVDLSRRLGDALGAHLASLEERRSITDAMDEAESWADLSPALRELVEDIEGRPGLVEAGGKTASGLWPGAVQAVADGKAEETAVKDTGQEQ